MRDASRPPTPSKRSLDHAFTFPPQEFKLDKGGAEDPTTGETFKVVAVEEDHVRLRRGKGKPPPAPAALVPGQPPGTEALRGALVELGESLLADDGRFAASRALLRRQPPRLPPEALGEGVDTLVAATLALDHSILPIQGPPGTGKTYRGARMVVAALRAGRRVGITAQSHAAIQNLLGEVEKCARRRLVRGRLQGLGLREPAGPGRDDRGQRRGHSPTTSSWRGTAWLFARPEHREAFDLLFIDEAGQFSLADAAAVGTGRAEHGVARRPAAARRR